MYDKLKTELEWELRGPTMPSKQQSTRQQRAGGQSLNMWWPAWNVTDTCGRRPQPEILKDAAFGPLSSRAGGEESGRVERSQLVHLALAFLLHVKHAAANTFSRTSVCEPASFPRIR